MVLVSRGSGVFSEPLILATTLVIFIIISLPGQGKAFAPFVVVNWSVTRNLNRKHIPNGFRFFPEGKSRPREVGGGGPGKMWKIMIFYCAVWVEASKGGWGLPSLAESLWLERDRQGEFISFIHEKWMICHQDPNTMFICQGEPQKAAYWPQ